MVTEEELSKLIKGWVLGNRTDGNTPVNDAVDLIASGTLDSMGFIELLSYIEQLTGQKIDLQKFDSNAFTSIQDLVRNIIYKTDVQVNGASMNPIVEAYSRLAEQYDDERNRHSCWGLSTEKALASLGLLAHHRVVVDVGCGTGLALAHLASKHDAGMRFIGVEPAANMRAKAAEVAQAYQNIEICDGAFERLPIDDASVDYLYSLYAFHWTTDLDRSVKELARALKPDAGLDLFFTGRHNGQEFLRKTTPIFHRYMGTAFLLTSVSLRKHLTNKAARLLFESAFPPERVIVNDSYQTYYDSLEGHWSWWIRAEGHFAGMPPEKKEQCDQEIKEALSELATEKGIPYTIHQIHVQLKSSSE
jgi:ubiquinone/menaquinone biosynthesis C-methylase UbiE/acyl carrier protein